MWQMSTLLQNDYALKAHSSLTFHGINDVD